MAVDPNRTTKDTLTQSLAQSISLRYPGRFDEQRVATIRRSLELVVNQVAVLRQYRLTNADEPDPIFRAYRGEG